MLKRIQESSLHPENVAPTIEQPLSFFPFVRPTYWFLQIMKEILN